MLQRIYGFVYLVLVALQAWGQTIHTIKVGDTGSFFDPGAVVASEGDTINFMWTGTFHSVTQSTFDDPCTPLEGGFDSQFQGNQPGVPLVTPQWNLTITNDTEPIWFFCKATMPMPHCLNGMVGVINAPISGANQSYDNFLAKAKALTSIPPIVTGSPILTGIGAFATSTPRDTVPSQNTISSVPQSSASSTSTSASTTPTVTSKSSGLSSGAKGAIIGGIVGAVVLITLIVLVIVFWRRGVRYRRDTMDHMRYHPPVQEIYHPRSNPSTSITRRRSLDLGSTADSLDREGSGSGSQTLNVKELAAEIARNMRHERVIPELPQSHYSPEMPSPPLAPVPERGYSTVPSPNYTNDFFQPPTPDSATTLLSQQQQQQSRPYHSPSRQLPRPPPPPSAHRGPKRPLDAMSVDTLPAYYGSTH